MIVMAVTAQIKPEKRDVAVQAAAKMVAATRAEPGCRRYGFYADLADPCRFLVFEEWENQEAIDLHFASDHMREFSAVMPEILAAEPDFRRYAIESVS